mmetsp:Transcript_10264/g.21744  ORF Transcript_10264/g.21744 Transcript_10264/m.21744 type:complete len:189 (+) Transcript_10264:145-711(+)
MTGLSGFCGALPLPTSVLVAFLVSLLRALVLLVCIAPGEDLQVGSMLLSGDMQILVTAAALMGVPISILAGFGVLYRIEKHVRLLVHSQAATLLLDTLLAIRLLASGGICSTLVHTGVLRSDPFFVCFLVDVGTAFWLAAYLAFEAYIAYAVLSQADVLLRGEFTELLRYEDAKSFDAEARMALKATS